MWATNEPSLTVGLVPEHLPSLTLAIRVDAQCASALQFARLKRARIIHIDIDSLCRADLRVGNRNDRERSAATVDH